MEWMSVWHWFTEHGGEWAITLALVGVTYQLYREATRTTEAVRRASKNIEELGQQIASATESQKKIAEAAVREAGLYASAMKSETLRWCTSAYFEIENKHDQLKQGTVNGDLRKAVEQYFERLWGLHEVEYVLYRLGALPKESYVTWLLVRNRNYIRNEKIAEVMNQKEGLEHAEKWVMDNDFISFVKQFIDQALWGYKEIERCLDDDMKKHTYQP